MFKAVGTGTVSVGLILLPSYFQDSQGVAGYRLTPYSLCHISLYNESITAAAVSCGRSLIRSMIHYTGHALVARPALHLSILCTTSDARDPNISHILSNESQEYERQRVSCIGGDVVVALYLLAGRNCRRFIASCRNCRAAESVGDAAAAGCRNAS